MRVALLHFTAPPIPGGVESVMFHQARVLSENGHDVTMVAGRGGRAAGLQAHFVRIPLMSATNSTQQRIARDLAEGVIASDFDRVVAKLQEQLTEVLSGQNAILVHNAFTLHFNQPLTSALAGLAAGPLRGHMAAWTHDVAGMNRLYVGEMHSGYPWDLLESPQAGVRYVAISRQRSDELMALWRSEGASDYQAPVIIPNGIDVASTLRLRPTTVARLRSRNMAGYDMAGYDMVLLLPVRITRRKNIEFAIRVVAELKQIGKRPLLMVTGPAAPHHPQRSKMYLAELRALSAKLEVADNVTFMAAELAKPLTTAEVGDLYAVADALFFPSQSEGFGLPIIEAGAHRLPIVASDLPVFKELAADGASYFDSNASPEEVARLVVKVTDAASNRLHSRAIRDYDWNVVYARMMDPLLQTLKRGEPQLPAT